jgi:hypothetical protein
MRRDTPAVAAVVVLAVVVSYLTGATAHRALPKVAATAPVVARTVACPLLDGWPPSTVSTAVAADVSGALSPAAHATGTVTSMVLDGPTSRSVSQHVAPTAQVASQRLKPGAVAFSATGPIAADLVVDDLIETTSGRYRELAGGNCLAPATDWWFAGASGQLGTTDRLFLANPSNTPAEVSVSLWTRNGMDAPPRLAAIPVRAYSRARIGILGVEPDIPIVALHVHAESGAVAATVVERRSRGLASYGGDLMPPTSAPSRNAVVTGFPAGGGDRQLVVVDPGSTDASVSFKVATPTGEYTPTAAPPIVVGAGRIAVVDLTQALGGRSGAVLVSSDQPVVVQGRSTSPASSSRNDPDLAWLAASRPLSGPAGVAAGREPDGGLCLLVLTAPQAGATVKVTGLTGHSQTITVAAGHTVEADVTATVRSPSSSWPFVVAPLTGGPVYGARILFFHGAHGPLITAEPLISLPPPIPLPVVREDQHLGIR